MLHEQRNPIEIAEAIGHSLVFDQYVNLRPVRLMPGVDGPLRDKKCEDIDMMCVRENTEGEYCGAGGESTRGSTWRWASRPTSSPVVASSGSRGTRSSLPGRVASA
jgi:isocitrate/isopropylmalate dehydrogenase